MKAVVLVLWFLSGIAQAEVFKCKTEAGHVSYSEKPCGAEALAYDSKRISVNDGAAGSVTLLRDKSGRFSVPGYINGQSTIFLIDTGANVTTIFADVGHRLGIRSCVPDGVSQTAGGAVPVCHVRLTSLSFGGFKFSDVSVVLSPMARGDALLGQDLLSGFKVNQENGVMTLSR